MNLFAFVSISCGLKANDVNYLAVSLQRVQRSEWRLNFASQTIDVSRPECKDLYVIGREITTVLKITVDNAIFEICDFYASPSIKWCGVYSINQWITLDCFGMCTALEKNPFVPHKLISEHNVNLYSSERSMKWPFPLNPRYAKNVIRNAFALIATTSAETNLFLSNPALSCL